MPGLAGQGSGRAKGLVGRGSSEPQKKAWFGRAWSGRAKGLVGRGSSEPQKTDYQVIRPDWDFLERPNLRSPRDLRRARQLLGPIDDRLKITRRVSVGRIACQQRGLAPAAAKVELFPGTGSARVRHPFGAAKTIEALGISPDPGERSFADGLKRETRYFSRRAW